mgnify:CR=1 FL=1
MDYQVIKVIYDIPLAAAAVYLVNEPGNDVPII